jgi:uncharacterized protein (DUF697 family)
VLATQLEAAQTMLRSLDRRIMKQHRANEAGRRLETIPGIGIIGASAIAATVSDPIDSSLKNVKQNDFNNEVAGSGCGEVNQNDFNNEVAGSSCGEQIEDILDGLVSAIIAGFESAVWAIVNNEVAGSGFKETTSTMKSLGQAAASKSTIFWMALSAR